MRLPELQHLFWQTVRTTPGPAEVEHAFRARGALDARARMDLYRTAYWVRQVDALRELFPSVVAALGDGPFARTASRYVQAHPSRSHALEHLGLAFPAWLTQTASPTLGEAASVDWLRWSVFVAVDEAPLPPSALQGLETAVLFVGAHVGAVRISRESLALAAPQLGQGEGHLAAWRTGFEVRQRLIAEPEARALEACRAGLDFASWCELLLGDAPADPDAAQRVFTTLTDWLRRGWLVTRSTTS